MHRWFLIAFLISLLHGWKGRAQVNWNLVNLATKDAKILSVPASHKPESIPPVTGRVFETSEGKIRVYLPPLSAGVTVSGTVYLEPEGKTERETGRNLLALQSYRLQLNEAPLPLQNGLFTTTLPATGGMVTGSLQLSTPTGQVLTRQEIPLQTGVLTNRGFSLPAYIVSGQTTGVAGNFDGHSGNTQLSMGGNPLPVLAESPGYCYFTPPPTSTGPQTLNCTDRETTQQAGTNVLSLQMQAGKTNLRKGQQTTLTLQVSGLEGLKENVPLLVQNLSPSVIALEGGNQQTILIQPGTDARSGVYTLTRNIQSTSSGGFSVTASIQPPAGSSRR